MLKFHEQAGSVVFTFGRFNPPTTGHEKLLNKVKMVSGSNPYRVYPSQSQNPKKDPLPFALKVAYMRKMFPKHAKNIMADKKIINVFDIAVKLYNEKYTDIGMVVGSDRVKEFRSLLDKYNGVTGKRHGYYKFRTISVISAGERDPDAEGVSGMSASKMRAAAYEGDLESFKLGVPKGFKEVEKLYKDVRKYMGLREQRDMGLMTDYEELRDAYLTGKVWNIDDLIEARGITGKIIRRGTNYIAFVDESNKVHKAWLHEITIDERPNWIARSQYAVDKITHPKEYETIVKKYVDGLEKGYGKHTVKKDAGGIEVRTKQSLIHDIVRRYGRKTLSVRSLIQYINKLVSKGKLPQEAGLKEVKQDKDIKDKEGTQPAKYYAGDMAKSTKDKRDAHFKKKKEGPAPGDATATTKPSKHTQKYKQMFGEDMINEKIEGLVNKSEKSGISYSILKKVYDRGMAAYKTGHRPGTTAQQWAMARVNSFITKGSGTWGKADKDLADKVRGESSSNVTTLGLAISKKKRKGHEVLGTGGAFASGESVKEWFESNETRAKYQIQYEDNWWWKLNETHDAMLEKLGICCEDCLTEEDMPCPPSTKDIKLNTKNRDATIKNHNYGPLNVDEPGDYWKDIAKYWKTTEEAAKKSVCNNCVAFDVSPRMLECMPGETSDDDGRLGYCHMHHFKCHSARACHTWAKGGPITTDEKSYDWQERGQKKENYKESLWANIHKKRQRIKQGSGERMRKKGEKGAPTPAQLKRAKGESKLHSFSQFQLRNAWSEITEKDNEGKELNNPTRGDVKKYKVYVKNDKGNVVKVEFGDPNMEIKRDDPERRKSFRARHNCENPGPKWKARYWSCKFWSAKSVTDLMKG